MPFLVCIVPVCPMRFAASHKSEQTSQLLFGDVVETITVEGDFVQVKYFYDGYIGWCQGSQLTEILTEQFTGYSDILTTDLVSEVLVNGQSMFIPLGCSIGHLKSKETKWGNYAVENKANVVVPNSEILLSEKIYEVAHQYLNTGYQWGGRSVFGVDCSGFTQMVFRFAGIPLLRDAYQQAQQGDAIGFLQEVKLGDLAFFDNDEGRITHVGILLNQQTIIHSSGKVRIDKIDYEGIISTDTGQRTHKLRVIKRMF